MRDEHGFTDFASARSGALRRQAYLLTGSPERAARVTERALSDTGRRWDKLGGPVAAEEHARRAIAAGALRTRGPVPAVAQTRVGTALPTDDSDVAVWRALAGLPPRRRAVLVLRYDEGLDDIAAGARLGIPPATAAAEAEAGLAALRSLLRRRGAPEDLLPATLAREPDPTTQAPPAPRPAPTPPPPSIPTQGAAPAPASGPRAAPVRPSPVPAPHAAPAPRSPAGRAPTPAAPGPFRPAPGTPSSPAGTPSAIRGTPSRTSPPAPGTSPPAPGTSPDVSGASSRIAATSAPRPRTSSGPGTSSGVPGTSSDAAGTSSARPGRPPGAGGTFLSGSGASSGRSGAAPVGEAPVGGQVGGGAGRWRWGIAAAVVAVVGVGAAVVVPRLGDDPAPAPAGPVPAALAGAPGELDWPARGPLAGDQDLLRDALRTWRDGVPARQQPADAAVLYAGAPDGARTVLLQGTDPSGQSWAAAVTEDAGTLALRAAEPLGRAAPLVVLPAGDQVRLLTAGDAGAGLLAAAPDGALKPVPLDADGLSAPVTPEPAGTPVVVTTGGTVAGSGTVLPGKLSAVSGAVEIGAGTLGLGPATPTAAWYADGALLARRLGGPVTVAAAGPARTTRVRIAGRVRPVDARAYEAVRGGVRHLATVVRIAGRPTCVQTAEVGPAGAQPRTPPVLVSRCRPAGASHGLLQVVAAAPVRTVRLTLPPVARGRPSRPVVLTGRAGDGLAALVPVLRLPANLLRAEARGAGGTVLSRPTVPADRGPRV